MQGGHIYRLGSGRKRVDERLGDPQDLVEGQDLRLDKQVSSIFRDDDLRRTNDPALQGGLGGPRSLRARR